MLPRVIASPMAGGVSTPALVTAVGSAGGLGFLAAGYKSVPDLAKEIAEVRAAQVPFGVNLFVPAERPSGPAAARRAAAVKRYRSALEPEAQRYGVQLPAAEDCGWDDDGWPAKLAELLEHPVPYVSFTFGVPAAEVVRQLQDAGSVVLVTVTSAGELESALSAGVNAAVVQHHSAGGHSAAFGAAAGEFSDAAGLVASLSHSPVPLIAAGGISGGPEARAAIRAGAAAVQLGTAFLRSPESGARQVHKDALASGWPAGTAVTRAFSGRAARGLDNRFMRTHDDAPACYPELHRLTAGLRAAAAAAGDPEAVSLWAGTGFRHASARPAGEIVSMLLDALA